VSNCCEPSAACVDARTACPSCARGAVRVDVQTVKALLTESAMQRVGSGPYQFCANPSCATVYFAGASQVFTVADVRVPVWQKLPFGSRTICYCFGENEADIRAEIEQTGRSEAVRRVREHIAAGRCACELRNPRGNCCLGDVSAAVKRAEGARQGIRNVEER